MRHPQEVEKQNKGFSLVEVLVTLAIISILSIPIIQSFVNSAKTNKRAKNVQNATDVAQSVSEHFDAMSLDDLEKEFEGKYSELKDGKIIFNNIGETELSFNSEAARVYSYKYTKDGVPYYKGSDGEKFFVSVVLDKNKYEESNNYVKPIINNLNENSSVTCHKKMEQYDSDIESKFAAKGVTVTDRSQIVRDMTFRITQMSENEDTFKKGKVEYRYYLDIKYIYSGVEILYDDIELGIGILDSTMDAPNLYIIYTPKFAMLNSSSLYSEDKITIQYRPGQTAQSWEKPVNVYLVQQKYLNGFDNTPSPIELRPENIRFEIYNNDPINVYGGATAVQKFSNADSSKVKFYTNITEWNKSIDKSADITTGDKKANTMYTMSVYVWKDKTNGITFDGEDVDRTMNTPEGYDIVVTNVKEE